MSSTANQQRAQKFCEWLGSPNLVLSTSLLLIFLFSPPVVRAQLRYASPDSSGTISCTVLLAEDNRPAGGLQVQVKSFAGGLAAMALTDGFGRFQVFGLRSGSYILVIEERGFEPFEETVQLHESSRNLLLYLKRAPALRTSQAGSTVSVRELKIPAKAHQAFVKGLAQLKKNDPAGSLARFAQAVAAFPNYYEAYYQMGVADMELGRKEEAERALQTAIDLSAGYYPPALYALGVLFCQRREFAEAERIIRRGLDLEGASWDGPLLFGRGSLLPEPLRRG
jgi:tetratricopeptide (TPR) repeat protein